MFTSHGTDCTIPVFMSVRVNCMAAELVKLRLKLGI